MEVWRLLFFSEEFVFFSVPVAFFWNGFKFTIVFSCDSVFVSWTCLLQQVPNLFFFHVAVMVLMDKKKNILKNIFKMFSTLSPITNATNLLLEFLE